MPKARHTSCASIHLSDAGGAIFFWKSLICTASVLTSFLNSWYALVSISKAHFISFSNGQYQSLPLACIGVSNDKREELVTCIHTTTELPSPYLFSMPSPASHHTHPICSDPTACLLSFQFSRDNWTNRRIHQPLRLSIAFVHDIQQCHPIIIVWAPRQVQPLSSVNQPIIVLPCGGKIITFIVRYIF